MSYFPYDVPTLIELVESRPCLWDKTTNEYKDRNLKKKQWEEVYMFLEKKFEDKTPKEQLEIGNMILTKWQHIRDAFVRSLKKKSGQGYVKKYIYADNLKFILKIIQKDDTESSISENDIPIDNDIDSLPENDQTEEILSPRSNKSKKKLECNKRQPNDEFEREIIKVLKASEKLPDEDESFFNSVLPSVRKMSEDDKFEFRMGVLNLIQSIKGRNKLQNPQTLTNHPQIETQINYDTQINTYSMQTEQANCSSYFSNFEGTN